MAHSMSANSSGLTPTFHSLLSNRAHPRQVAGEFAKDRMFIDGLSVWSALESKEASDLDNEGSIFKARKMRRECVSLVSVDDE